MYRDYFFSLWIIWGIISCFPVGYRKISVKIFFDLRLVPPVKLPIFMFLLPRLIVRIVTISSDYIVNKCSRTKQIPHFRHLENIHTAFFTHNISKNRHMKYSINFSSFTATFLLFRRPILPFESYLICRLKVLSMSTNILS